jgi:hypothetical protein
VLHGAAGAVGRAVVAERRSLSCDAGSERSADAAVKRGDLGVRELAGGLERVDLGTPERLVRVDVPDPGQAALVEDRGLDGSLPPLKRFGQAACGEGRRERFPADPRGEVGVELSRLGEELGAEAPDVAIHDVRAVV